jgi:hypothetical protein
MLELREDDRKRLADLARLPSVPSWLAKQARIVLVTANGMPNVQITRSVRRVAADRERLARPVRGGRFPRKGFSAFWNGHGWKFVAIA